MPTDITELLQANPDRLDAIVELVDLRHRVLARLCTTGRWHVATRRKLRATLDAIDRAKVALMPA